MALIKPIIRLTCASAAATSAMTLFSYTLSKIFREDYREPELLSSIIVEEIPAKYGAKQARYGWAAHYLMGFLWAFVYEIPLGNYHFPVSKGGKSAFFGVCSGLVAIAAWRVVLSGHRHTLQRTKPSFFLHLVPAHIVYGLTLQVSKSWIKKPRKKNIVIGANTSL